jgi:alkaline phosphatase
MPKYVDGFVLVVPKKKLGVYRRMAQVGAKVWKKYGALDYKECVADDLRSYPGTKSVFLAMTKLKAGETIIFSYIVFRSRAHRDSVNAKVMKDPLIKKFENMVMPFDMKRMAQAGFKVIVDAK